VTSLLVMHGVGEGLLHLDTPLGNRLPMLADRPEVTLRRILAHAAGFPAHRKFYQEIPDGLWPRPDNRTEIVRRAAAEPASSPPGSRSIYSDLGFILLGELLEESMGARLDVLANRLLFQPLQLASMGFADLLAGAAQARFHGHDVAPTERCPVRGKLVLGEVHDLNAYAMGGVAGHAGLFGNANDLLSLSFALCAAYRGSGVAGAAPLVPPDVLRLFWQPAAIANSTWRLGWDGPAAVGSLAGSRLSRRAVGHLSFTGCSLWIDAEQETCVVVLCNRIHPKVRDDPRFRALRPALNDAALEAIGYRAR
jgi:CubicO group peptidase (beta-lactamase class C family)